MGVSKSPLKLAAKMTAASATFLEIPAIATKAAGEAASGIIRSGSPATLRNVGKKGARLGIRVIVVRTPAGATGTVKAVGPWAIIEEDTRAHRIPKTRKRGQKTLRLPDGSFRKTVRHPGTRGKHPFRKGAEVAKPLIPKFYEEAATAALKKIF